MRITLQIENVDRLETGGQLSYSCTDRGFDIGRHEHLDWSLPDPQRVISGKHCEVRFEGGQFVLYDFSTNGTFLNGSQTRMDKAHVLRSGDRVMIGDYIIAVSLEASTAQAPTSSAQSPASSQPWNAPQPEPVSSGPGWPGGAGPQSPYPVDAGGGGPWVSSGAGMEGRHAPPSLDPGIGTPADSVWGQQGHGGGGADPVYYDPQAQEPVREQARPAQADPMDHLAQQPHLYPEQSAPAGPAEPAQPSGLANTPSDAGQAPEPLFKMPDMESPDSSQAESVSASASPASPFPETPAAATPSGDAPVWPAAEPSARPESSPAIQSEPEPAAKISKPQPAIEAPQSADEPAPQPSATPAVSAESIDFLKAFAEGAGLPPDALKGRDPEAFARELGAVLNGITGDLMGLLQARSQVKAMTRNANRTLIMRSGNNALKFSPTPQMALQTMLSPRAEEDGYLPISKAMSAAFKDIQKHHVWTYAAMQKAAARFEATLSPKAVEADGQVAKSTFGNQKAKLWEKMEERWASLTQSYDDGLVGVFTQYFTESYEEMSGDDMGSPG